MTSTPPRHGSTGTGSSIGQSIPGQPLSTPTLGNAFAPQAPPQYVPSAGPAHHQMRSPAPAPAPFAEQSSGYPRSAPTFRAPTTGPGPAMVPASGSSVAYQKIPAPQTFMRPHGSIPSSTPPTAGPLSAPPLSTSMPSRPSPSSASVVQPPVMAPPHQPPTSGSLPSMPGYSAVQQPPFSGSYSTSSPWSQPPVPGSFPTSASTPQRGPPSFGLAQAPTSMAYQAPSVNSGGAFLGAPGQISSQGPPFRSDQFSQAQPPPQFRPPNLQPGSQRPHYGGQPAVMPNYADTAVMPNYADSRSHIGAVPYPGIGPPLRTMQALTEEFQSLSMATVPGSIDATIDPNSLPRPSAASDYPATNSTANCHPRYLRLTCGSLPNSHSLVARWHLPLGAVVHPLAEALPNEEVPVINFGTSGIVRCRRCRTYVNPYAVFTDNGRRWRCNVCGLTNEVPSEYYCPLDENGRRRDADERPELSQGSVEFVAPAEYMVRPPMPPVYFFLIDVSSSAIKTGMLQIAVDTIKSCLDKLPGYPRTQIGFLTFDSALHFYCLKSTLSQPQMMVVADLDDPFLPMPDDLLVNLSESRAVVEVLLDSLPSMFKSNSNVEAAVGPALRAVFMIMSQLGGKLLLFQSSLPSLGVGRLKTRGDDQRIYGSDKEPSLRNAEDPFYKQMAADFSKYQIGVNIYAFPEKYIDLVSLGTLAKYTGGQVYYYPLFQPHLHGDKLKYELSRDLTRETAWEAVMRIRCGKGVRFSTFHGHFMLRSSDLMALPAVDCDKAFAMQLTLEDTLLASEMVYFQVALLYTSSNGERRIRIHTLAAPVVSDLNEMYRTADTGAITMLMSRLAIEKSLVSKLDDVRQQMIQERLVRALREYRNLHGVQHPVTGRLIYPESLKLLPLYCLALNKSLALRGGYPNASLDECTAASFEMMIMSIPRLLKLLYPSFFRLDEYLVPGEVEVKSFQQLPLSSEKLDARGAFFLNDGFRFLVWLGKVLPSDFVVQLLGIEAANSADLSKVVVYEQNNNISKRFTNLLQSFRESIPAVHQQCVLVRQGDQPREGFVMLFNLVEDRFLGTVGYAEWMIQLYRQVQQQKA